MLDLLSAIDTPVYSGLAPDSTAASRPKAAAMTYQYQEILEMRAAQFCEALAREGISAEIAFYRAYLVKISLGQRGAAKIYYKPKNVSFSLELGELKDKSCKPVLERVFNTVEGSAKSGQQLTGDDWSLRQADYYYQVLLPYRHLAFDFIAFANALSAAAKQRGLEVSASDAHYSFDELETLYLQIKGST